jgi:DNA repair and recombination protein RAD52
MFTEQQEKDLSAPLAGELVKQRQGANRQSLSYLEAWQLIADANRIFGFGNWSRETVQMEALHEPKLVTDNEAPERGKVVAAYFARVRVTVWAKNGARSIVREGCGAARGFARTVGEAMESAIKAAETDAMKRALVTFGDQFGLTLYDKAQRNVAMRGSRARIAANEEQPLDTGFERPRGLTTSERAGANGGVARRGRVADASDLPV